VNITNRQIEAEIVELLAEADRKVASVKAIFEEAALLRKQADCLRQVLTLRTRAEHRPELMSFVLMGLAPEAEREPTALCAFTWTGPANTPTDLRILLKRDWTQLVPNDVASYFKDLLNDWTQTVQIHPAMVIAMVAELSVGPIRTIKQDAMDRDRVALLMQERLGEVLYFPGVTLVK
jgi:hypothetical protein